MRCHLFINIQQIDPTSDTTGPTLPPFPSALLAIQHLIVFLLEIGETVVLFSIVDFLQCPEHSREILDAQVSTVNRVCVCVSLSLLLPSMYLNLLASLRLAYLVSAVIESAFVALPCLVPCPLPVSLPSSAQPYLRRPLACSSVCVQPYTACLCLP